MFNLDDITNENNKERYKKWPYIPDYPYRILIISASGSGKTDTLIKEQDDIDAGTRCSNKTFKQFKCIY